MNRAKTEVRDTVVVALGIVPVRLAPACGRRRQALPLTSQITAAVHGEQRPPVNPDLKGRRGVAQPSVVVVTGVGGRVVVVTVLEPIVVGGVVLVGGGSASTLSGTG